MKPTYSQVISKPKGSPTMRNFPRLLFGVLLSRFPRRGFIEQLWASRLLPAAQIGPAGILQADPLHKKDGGRPANGISAGSCHHSANNVTPARKKLQDGTGPFAQEHSRSHIRT